MTTIMKKTYIIIAVLAFIMAGCSQDKLSEKSIFEDTPTLNPSSPTYDFDLYLYENYLKPYNISFKYRLADGSTDMNYNLVPVEYEAAQTTAHAVKFLWLDVYSKQLAQSPWGKDSLFLQKYAPRILNVLGSPAMNAAQGTETLGVAEGGVKITLYNMNNIDLSNQAWLNKYIFHVMHHEFSHILHQTKSFPKEYEQLSAGLYDSQGWQYKQDTAAYHLGFVTPYSMSEAHEDFVEVISSYITDSIPQWKERGFEFSKDHTHIVKYDAFTPGAEIISQKIEMAREWLQTKYGFELDSIRAEVQRRQDYLKKNPTRDAMDAYGKK